MSDNFWVKPAQPAESDTAGPQLPVAAFTPQPAALSRARSALSAGFCCSASVSSSDRKSTRLNSSHSQISYAVFCLKKKKQNLKTRYLSLQIATKIIKNITIEEQ